MRDESARHRVSDDAGIAKAFDLPAQKDRRCAEHGEPGQMR
jgi:hypothetical protein